VGSDWNNSGGVLHRRADTANHPRHQDEEPQRRLTMALRITPPGNYAVVLIRTPSWRQDNNGRQRHVVPDGRHHPLPPGQISDGEGEANKVHKKSHKTPGRFESTSNE